MGSKSKPGQSVIAEGISLAPLEPYTIFSGTLFHYSEQTMRVYGLNLAGRKSIIYSEEKKPLRQTCSFNLELHTPKTVWSGGKSLREKLVKIGVFDRQVFQAKVTFYCETGVHCVACKCSHQRKLRSLSWKVVTNPHHFSCGIQNLMEGTEYHLGNLSSCMECIEYSNKLLCS